MSLRGALRKRFAEKKEEWDKESRLKQARKQAYEQAYKEVRAKEQIKAEIQSGRERAMREAQETIRKHRERGSGFGSHVSGAFNYFMVDQGEAVQRNVERGGPFARPKRTKKKKKRSRPRRSRPKPSFGITFG